MDKESRLNYLSWKIIEWKLMYYNPELVKPEFHSQLEIPDYEYDAREEEYVNLCLELNKPNTVAHKWSQSLDSPKLRSLSEGTMVEPDLTRPSVQLVLKKYGYTNNE